jgi:hypothetical protein
MNFPLISLSIPQQELVYSSTEALAKAIVEVIWIKSLLKELQVSQPVSFASGEQFIYIEKDRYLLLVESIVLNTTCLLCCSCPLCLFGTSPLNPSC